MKAYVFPGQGAQFEGMGKDLYDHSDLAKDLFHQANELLGFKITDIMFNGSLEDLKQTKVTQPAIFLHSTITAAMRKEDFHPEAVAGHSLGEFSALVANGVLNFEEGLLLVKQRAFAMQKACEDQESTMAAVLGLADEKVEEICEGIDEVVVPANYNCPGQLVISGSMKGIEEAVKQMTAAGAMKAIVLPVGGAFHSPLMASAKEELKAAIEKASFQEAICPIYQNVNALPTTDTNTIRENLIAQLTAPVKWTQTIQNMLADGATSFIEVGGTGKVLRGMIKRVNRKTPSDTLSGIKI